ncbi:hypothetical protein F5Y18DRAFT_392250 [Xylariaceae sp. FL1019]|nr:hypothetical protein F5Y18DRAFT_392250 [Xylariaceae sp. FL1019]
MSAPTKIPPEAVAADRYLCHLVWIQHTAEEARVYLSIGDHNPDIEAHVLERQVDDALCRLTEDREADSQDIEDGRGKENDTHVIGLSFPPLQDGPR